MSDDRDTTVEEATGADDADQPRVEPAVEVNPGMAAFDAAAAEAQGEPGSDPSWGPQGIPDLDVPEDEDEDDGDPVVSALVSALRSGNAGDAENALALAADAGHDVSGSGSVEIQNKKDLAGIAAEAQEEADEAEAEREDDES